MHGNKYIKAQMQRPVGRRRHRWENCITVNLKGRGCEGVNYIHRIRDHVPMTGSCEHGNEISGFI